MRPAGSPPPERLTLTLPAGRFYVPVVFSNRHGSWGCAVQERRRAPPFASRMRRAPAKRAGRRYEPAAWWARPVGTTEFAPDALRVPGAQWSDYSGVRNIGYIWGPEEGSNERPVSL